MTDQMIREGEPAPTLADLHGSFTVPADRRPYRRASLGGDERKLRTDTHNVWFRQIGWHGQSGAFYSLDERPMQHEPGSFGPLWIEVDSYPIEDD